MKEINPKLDLIFERHTDVRPELIWKAWTEPELLMQWFCPLPWKVVECEMDLRPGGKFMTLMKGPEGERVPNQGCFLEIEKGRKLVWTSALLADYRPIPAPDNGVNMPFTATIEIAAEGNGSKYLATVLHKDETDRTTHEQMGFQEGWGAAFDQLVDLMSKR